MNSLKIACLVFLMQFATAFAHEPNEAYFEFRQSGDAIIVRAEFSWTLRQALLQAYPKLERERTQAAFDRAIFNYFDTNIVLHENGAPLALKGLEQEKQGQSHSVVYILEYENLKQLPGLVVSNSCLFDLYENQKNYLTFLLPGGEKITTVATKSNSDFGVPGGSVEASTWGSGIFVGLLCLAIWGRWTKRSGILVFHRQP